MRNLVGGLSGLPQVMEDVIRFYLESLVQRQGQIVHHVESYRWTLQAASGYGGCDQILPI